MNRFRKEILDSPEFLFFDLGLFVADMEGDLRFQTLFNSAHDSIFMMSQETFIDCNEATLKIFRCTRDQIIGQTPSRYSPQYQPDGSLSSESAMKRISAALAGQPQIFEWMHIHYDGSPFDAEVSLNRIDLEEGTFIQAIVRDITERKQAQEAIEKKNVELLKINEELDRFVYSASHDLRAPIASLLGLIHVARMEESIDRIKELLNLQEKSLLRLDRFIKDIVDYSRNTRLYIQPSMVDFQSLVGDAFEQLYYMEDVDKIEKVIKIEQQEAFLSDPKRLEIIFNNLISNAIKYADFRKPQSVIAVEVKANAKTAEIIIKDNGEGIRPESKEKIFEMFFRASERSSGSGLGLYIVKEAIEKLGGELKMDSVFGEGTEFRITVPAISLEINFPRA